MQVLSVEASRIVSLVTMGTTKGRPFLPKVIAKVAQRYSFQKFPSKVDDLTEDGVSFQIGEMNGIQIDELAVFHDGIIVRSSCNTDILDELVDDLYVTIREGFGLSILDNHDESRSYESSLVLSLSEKASAKFDLFQSVGDKLAKFQTSYGLGNFAFSSARFDLEVDATAYAGKRPVGFTLARRVGVPFEKNVWFSSGPLKTSDHIAVLQHLETLMLA